MLVAGAPFSIGEFPTLGHDVKKLDPLLLCSSKMVPDKNARLRELINLVANENNAIKRKILALELQRLLNEEQNERDGGWSSPLGDLE